MYVCVRVRMCVCVCVCVCRVSVPFLSALSFMDTTSEPEFGSLIANAPT